MNFRTHIQVFRIAPLGYPLIFLLFSLLPFFGFHSFASAQTHRQTSNDERYRWHLKAGIQVAHQNPDIRYDQLNIYDIDASNSNPDRPLTTFSSVSLQHDLTDASSLELSYHADGAGGKIHGEKLVRFFFFNVPLQFREPLEIDLRRFRLQYSHRLWQSGQFRLGASVAVQAWQVSMDAKLPELFRSMGADEHFDYLVFAPSLGAFAEYRTNGPLTYRLSSEWMSAPLGDVEGKLVGFNAGVDYRLTDQFFLGFGYRFFDLNINLHQEHYNLKSSYEVHGYQMHAGFDF